MKWLFGSAFLLMATLLCAQPSPPAAEDEPKDYLPASFHEGRREALRTLMPENSVMVVFAYPTRNFSNDVDYLYHANPDLYYFTGYKEPHGVLFIFKNEQKDGKGNTYKELFFVQPRHPLMEQWNGKRMGKEGVQSKLGIASTFNNDDFKNYPIDFQGFDKIIFDEFRSDMVDEKQGNQGLSGLVTNFRQKAGIPDDYQNNKRFDTKLYRKFTAELREVKTEEELVLLRKAVEISCQGQNEVMRAVHPEMSELEIQGLHEFVHKKHGAEGAGYGAIIGSGENGCTLHYETNTKTRIGNSLVLMDVGAEYHGYTADVTRTIPAKGKFSEEEKKIYQLVYDAQEAAFALLKEGATWQAINKAARDVIVKGLVKLGVAKTEAEANKYYPHGLGHHIGMDVHDRSAYGPLKKNMVITIEPGIYIPSDSKCDPKWWGIAVRIEDDARITEEGYELLSKYSPRSIEDIEKMIREKSALDDFKLPELESGKKKGF
jgi:Xaa-Pro aminopeptidase